MGVYAADGAGAFAPVNEVLMPPGMTATGIAAENLDSDGRPDLLVTVKGTAAPESKALLVYFSFNASFAAPISKPYVAPPSLGGVRIATGRWDNNNRADVVIVDGETVKLFPDVGKQPVD